MDCKDDTSLVLSATERNFPGTTLKLKRKRGVKVAPLAESCGTVWGDCTSKSCGTDQDNSTVKICGFDRDNCGRCGTFGDDCKRPKFDASKVKYEEGSVPYESFSAELFGWPSKLFMQNACNFQRSGPPSRVMFYDHGEWKDFAEAANASLCASFKAGKNSTELLIDGKRYFVNFLQMLQLNLVTDYLRSIAWIDVHGKCFFPSKCIVGHRSRLLLQHLDTSDHQIWLSEACAKGFDSCRDGLIKICSDSSKPPTETSSVEATSEITSELTVGGEALSRTECPAVHVSHDFALLGDKLIKLDEVDHEFTVVQNKFFAGLGMLATYTTIKGIYKDCHKSTSGQARLQAFKRQEEISKIARGDANLKYAWHGTSKQGVSGIVLHGFGQPRIPKNGAMYGVGVYLAPEDYSHVSAVYSDVDDNGEQHMVLCRAIMGNMEQVPQGSEQFHPSSEDYDTGVDDIFNPKRYIIWSTHMNTYILPEYIVSFKLASPWHDIIAALRGKQISGKKIPTARGLRLDGQAFEQSTSVKAGCAPCKPVIEASAGCGLNQGCSTRAPRSPWMSFPMLFLVMKAKLPAVKMSELQQHYLLFKAGRMPRDELIKVVRCIAGDRLLADSIRSMQAQEKANHSLTSMNLCPSSGPPQIKEDGTVKNEAV